MEGRDQAHAPRTSYAAGMKWFVTDDIKLVWVLTARVAFITLILIIINHPIHLGNIVLGYQRDQWKYEFWAGIFFMNIFHSVDSILGMFLLISPHLV
ncbi:MAG: hypothetical protein Ct9H300mP6_00680 [Gammaproteobacteria bacterium]|nr:MAG: hypothetical protein Ct9H300mP6_00680 [Gammaproteobacteria bacterium]